jgi:hypothetical protein
MTVHRLDETPPQLVRPDLKLPRFHPCQARGLGVSELCGATPASRWRRSCGTPSHEREVWMCGTHANMTARGMTCCAECRDRGVDAVVTISPVELLLARG